MTDGSGTGRISQPSGATCHIVDGRKLAVKKPLATMAVSGRFLIDFWLGECTTGHHSQQRTRATSANLETSTTSMAFAPLIRCHYPLERLTPSSSTEHASPLRRSSHRRAHDVSQLRKSRPRFDTDAFDASASATQIGHTTDPTKNRRPSAHHRYRSDDSNASDQGECFAPPRYGSDNWQSNIGLQPWHPGMTAGNYLAEVA